MNEYNLWYSLVKLPNKIKLELLKEFKSTENLWSEYKNKNNLLFYNDKIINSFESAWKNEIFDFNKKLISLKRVNVVSFNEDLYPENLKFFDDAPSVLYYEGNIKQLNEKYNIAVVGSRNCSNYGVDVTKLITKELCVNNINIISGLAKGIDFHAHSTAIESSGYTCAVLGCGIDIIYPKENKRVYEKIINEGCIISEFPPGTKPYAYNFPMRNRIISALSKVILVIEAGDKSGSLITARLASEQGKDVVVVPGSIFSEQSKGANKLIQDGAYIFTEMEDIFDLLGIKYIANGTNNNVNVSKKEEKIFSLISNNPIHIDDIIRITNIDIKQLYEVLFELQLKNAIMCLSGNYYVKANNKI